MLKLILGRAKAGKTALMMEEIRLAGASGRERSVMIVPEQYSHEAEREALSKCGDSFSLHAEVLSFTRLASRVEGEVGTLGRLKPLSRGGKLLCMALALDAVGSRLKVYSAARRKAEVQQSLLAAIDELKTAQISSDKLLSCAEDRTDSLSDKLRDIALVYEAYAAIAARSGADPTDRLDRLCENLDRSSLKSASFFIDGFIDFTAQENAVIETLLKLGCDVTVCLTCESLAESHEIFEPSRRAAAKLCRIAGSLGAEFNITNSFPDESGSTMESAERHLFGFEDVQLPSADDIVLRRGQSIAAECEAAAARCCSLVRDTGCRFRDIAVAVRGYDKYAACLEGIMAHYGVPFYEATKTDVLQKPLPLLIKSAFDIISGGFRYEDIMVYLRTGLAGLSFEECDLLDSYAFLWSIRGSAWYREEPWTLHPRGYGNEYTEEDSELLLKLGRLRKRVSEPLYRLGKSGAKAKNAREQCEALTEFFRELDLPASLRKRSRELSEIGLQREAEQYAKLWDITVESLEETAAILDGMEMTQEEFGKLFRVLLSGYDVGTIPLSLDSVTAGDFDRMRRRSIRHLIVLGCDSSAVPSAFDAPGIFSDDDRDELIRLGVELGDTAPDRLCREYALAYNCLTLPEKTLYISYCPDASGEGAKKPSFVVSRLRKIFRLEIQQINIDECRQNAPLPAFELAARAFSRGGSETAAAAREYFMGKGRDKELSSVAQAAKLSRGRLSKASVSALYGEKLKLSASRIDSFSSCRFSYFLRYGLKARPRQAAKFSPPEMGSFMHYVLERVASGIKELGGFKKVTKEQTDDLCVKFVKSYVHEYLNDFREKSGRFIYLFNRLSGTVRVVVADMVQELSRSDFEPLDFELDFGNAGEFPPIEVGGGDRLYLTGIADRVDGYEHDGKLFVRVVDYKTGVKKFSLSDVWYGMGLQMLLYLFVLAQYGERRFKKEIVPAGVLYVPARDVLLSSKVELSGEEIVKERAKKLKRSGLLLDDSTILNAMENGEPMYIPVSFKKGSYSGESLASLERLGTLSRHIEKTLAELSGELRAGSIDADPYFRSQTDTACANCDFFEACQFDEKCDARRYIQKLKTQDAWQRIEDNAKGGDGA